MPKRIFKLKPALEFETEPGTTLNLLTRWNFVTQHYAELTEFYSSPNAFRSFRCSEQRTRETLTPLYPASDSPHSPRSDPFLPKQLRQLSSVYCKPYWYALSPSYGSTHPVQEEFFPHVLRLVMLHGKVPSDWLKLSPPCRRICAASHRVLLASYLLFPW